MIVANLQGVVAKGDLLVGLFESNFADVWLAFMCWRGA